MAARTIRARGELFAGLAGLGPRIAGLGDDRAYTRHGPHQALLAERRQCLGCRGHRDTPFPGDLPCGRDPVARHQGAGGDPPLELGGDPAEWIQHSWPFLVH
jgi:hypothetical protein